MKRAPLEHDLKCWPREFAAVRRGDKRHETRRTDDRDFRVGDTLLLREWVPPANQMEEGHYTGRQLRRLVSYIARGGTWGLPVGLCVMSIRPMPDKPSQRGGLARARNMSPQQRSEAARKAARARWGHRATAPEAVVSVPTSKHEGGAAPEPPRSEVAGKDHSPTSP